MSGVINVLSIDGGGIRGIIPARILQEIEKRTKKPIAELFHLIAGTSTGGILALGLTKAGPNGRPQYPAEKLLEMYETEGAQIFSRSLWHRVTAIGSLIEEKYPSDGIETVLDEYFKQARLKDALTNVLITSYEIERRNPFFFKSRKAKMGADSDFLVKHVARATSAAPTYFEPAQIKNGKNDYWALVDGGVFANNPAMCAYVEAKKNYPDADDILVVSLGTGSLTRPLPYEEATGWGMAQWAQPLLSVMFDGVSETVDYQLGQLLPNSSDGQARYYRFQVRLDEGDDDMDNTTKTNLRVLRLLADGLIRDNSNNIDVLCGQLLDRCRLHPTK
ncbi:MAG: CBASS cGAMP-activated phospholipase [Acidobacteriota bacterium]